MEIVKYRTNYMYLGPACGESKMIVAELTEHFEDYVRKIDFQFTDLHFFHAVEFSMSMGGYRISLLDPDGINLENNVMPEFLKLSEEESKKFSEKITEELTNSDLVKIIRFDKGRRYSFDYLERLGEETIHKSDYNIDLEEVLDLLDQNFIVKAKDLNGNWVEGSLRIGGFFDPQQPGGKIISFQGEELDIQPGTICSYSGFYAKNGKRIYDGDFIKEGRVYVHTFRNGYYIDNKSKKIVNLTDFGSFQREIVGNVFD